MELQYTTNLLIQFRSLCEELSHIIEGQGFVVRPYISSSMPHFQGLSYEEKKRVVGSLVDSVKLCRHLYSAEPGLLSEAQLTKKALDYFGFEYSAKILDMMDKPGQLIEFHLHHTQFFRNLRYYEMTSYTIEDLSCRSWLDLYSRDSGIQEKIYKIREQMSADQEGPFEISERHVLQERATLERLSFLIKRVTLFPLKKNGHLAAAAIIIDCDSQLTH